MPPCTTVEFSAEFSAEFKFSAELAEFSAEFKFSAELVEFSAEFKPSAELVGFNQFSAEFERSVYAKPDLTSPTSVAPSLGRAS